MSHFKGVSWNKRAHKWMAGIMKDGRQTHLGCFDDKEKAVRAHDAAGAHLGPGEATELSKL